MDSRIKEYREKTLALLKNFLKARGETANKGFVPYFRSYLGGVRTQIPQFYFMPMTQNIVQTLWVVKPNKNISYF